MRNVKVIMGTIGVGAKQYTAEDGDIAIPDEAAAIYLRHGRVKLTGKTASQAQPVPAPVAPMATAAGDPPDGIDVFDLEEKDAALLTAAGIETADQLEALSVEDLVALPGIGDVTANRIYSGIRE